MNGLILLIMFTLTLYAFKINPLSGLRLICGIFTAAMTMGILLFDSLALSFVLATVTAAFFAVLVYLDSVLGCRRIED